MNYTLQDIIGITLAFGLYPIILVFPGYVTGWLFDLFDFKYRQPLAKLGIGLILSFSISPIILDISSSLVAQTFSLILLGGFTIVFAAISDKAVFRSETKQQTVWAAGVCITWFLFATISLIDIQWDNQLYFSLVSSDQTSRVSVIDAMTRTGVPPINPGYYPGTPVRLTFLYYFWYIPSSFIDMLGGELIDARAALNASSAWAGIGLTAMLVFYLRQRNPQTTWISIKTGAVMFTISGLDALFFFLMPKAGLNEQWGDLKLSILLWNNMHFSIFNWLATWVESLLWVPHHVAALIASFTSIMLAHTARRKTISKQFVILSISSVGFASSLGLSVWVTIIFVIFWGAWALILFFRKVDRKIALLMFFSGILAVVIASPFLINMYTGGSEGAGENPVVFEVRRYSALEPYLTNLTDVQRSLITLFILPIDLLIETGFFFFVGIYWLKIKGWKLIQSNSFYFTETMLLVITLIFTSFLSSTIANNDLGIRAWLAGQLILLIWSVDVIELIKNVKGASPARMQNSFFIRSFFYILIAIGIATSIGDTLYFRFLWPLWEGRDYGEKNFDARLTYDYLRDHIPSTVITQNNPMSYLDIPSGLYGSHQMIIADRTIYGVNPNTVNIFKHEVGKIFNTQNQRDWRLADQICIKYGINVLIVTDTDPIWKSFEFLDKQRSPLFRHPHYALYTCGEYVDNNK